MTDLLLARWPELRAGNTVVRVRTAVARAGKAAVFPIDARRLSYQDEPAMSDLLTQEDFGLIFGAH